MAAGGAGAAGTDAADRLPDGLPPEGSREQARVQALQQELQRLGWTTGANIQFDERWTTDDMELVRAHAVESGGTQSGRHRHEWGRVVPNIHFN